MNSDSTIQKKYLVGKYPIIKKENIARNCFDFTILCPEIASLAQPGQFAHVRVEGFSLRRPISICEIHPEKGTIRLVFEVRGDGTRVLSSLNENSMIDLIAPLGNGFTILAPDRKVIVVGGGIGVPPMLEVAKRSGANVTAITGFRSASAVILEHDFLRVGAELMLCTDDGTAGRKGFVTAALEERLQRDGADLICACGPAPMLKGVVALAEQFQVRCEISLEERMGCGVGACLVCACKTVKDGAEIYTHVCKDGPVFPAQAVVWE